MDDRTGEMFTDEREGSMKKFEYKILDHKWNNLKRWVEACEQSFGKYGLIKVGRMGDMMEIIQSMSDKTDDIVVESINRSGEHGR